MFLVSSCRAKGKKQLGNILGTDIFPVSLGLDSVSPCDNSFPGSGPGVTCGPGHGHHEL